MNLATISPPTRNSTTQGPSADSTEGLGTATAVPPFLALMQDENSSSGSPESTVADLLKEPNDEADNGSDADPATEPPLLVANMMAALIQIPLAQVPPLTSLRPRGAEGRSADSKAPCSDGCAPVQRIGACVDEVHAGTSGDLRDISGQRVQDPQRESRLAVARISPDQPALQSGLAPFGGRAAKAAELPITTASQDVRSSAEYALVSNCGSSPAAHMGTKSAQNRAVFRAAEVEPAGPGLGGTPGAKPALEMISKGKSSDVSPSGVTAIGQATREVGSLGGAGLERELVVNGAKPKSTDGSSLNEVKPIVENSSGMATGLPLNSPAAAGETRNSDITPAVSASAVISKIHEAVDHLQHVGKGRIDLRIILESGDQLDIRLKITGNAVHTTIATQSQEIQDALRTHWSELAENRQVNGYRFENPSFEGGRASLDQGTLNDFQRQPRPQQSDSDGVAAGAVPHHPQPSRKESASSVNEEADQSLLSWA